MSQPLFITKESAYFLIVSVGMSVRPIDPLRNERSQNQSNERSRSRSQRGYNSLPLIPLSPSLQKDDFFEQFLEGAVFGNSEKNNLKMEVKKNGQDLKDIFYNAKQVGPEKKGTYNKYFVVDRPTQDKTLEASGFNTDSSGNIKVGRRGPVKYAPPYTMGNLGNPIAPNVLTTRFSTLTREDKKKLEFAKKVYGTWTEIETSIKLAEKGLAPPVYAAGVTTNGSAWMLLRAMSSSLSSVLNNENVSDETFKLIGKDLTKKIREISDMNLLLVDIKAGNITVDTSTNTVYFIDFGADFSAFVTDPKVANTECIMLVNSFLMLSWTLCDHWRHGRRGRLIAELLTLNLRNEMANSLEKVKKEERWRNANESGNLCDTLLNLRYSNLDDYYARNEEAFEAEKRNPDPNELLESEKVYLFKTLLENDPDSLMEAAEFILSTAAHYCQENPYHRFEVAYKRAGQPIVQEVLDRLDKEVYTLPRSYSPTSPGYSPAPPST